MGARPSALAESNLGFVGERAPEAAILIYAESLGEQPKNGEN